MFTKTLKELSKKNVGIAGGKGASLGEMSRLLQGYGGRSPGNNPVPAGFVVLASAFDRFLEETDLGVEIASLLKKINYKDLNSVDAASYQIRDMIHDVPMPKDLKQEFLVQFRKLKSSFVAVRSSATAEDSSVASWAGELETYLNTTKKNLNENIRKCWSSLFTQRALFYAFEKGLVGKKGKNKIRATTSKRLKDAHPVSVAVVVQKMVQSEISGICFTVHPVTENKNQMVIEAGYGLGEAIVGGKITPDTYVIDKSKISAKGGSASGGKNQKLKKGNIVLDKNIAEQNMMIVRSGKGVKEVKVPKSKTGNQKLTDKQILELARICMAIEKHYKFPQDIEWALEKGNFYITQSRPITTLTSRNA